MRFLVQTIKHMTKQSPSARCTAFEMSTSILSRPGFCCSSCRSQSPVSYMEASHLAHSGPVNAPLATARSTARATTPVAPATDTHITGTRVNMPAPWYTPWEWSYAHNKHYSYLLDSAGTILDTLWSPPLSAPPGAHRVVEEADEEEEPDETEELFTYTSASR
jgi:hypothetical protein